MRRDSGRGSVSDVYARVYAVVKRIPPGRVASYGQVAELAGMPGQARRVGYAMAALDDDAVPWQRVIDAQGRISPRADPDGARYQRLLLEEEGVVFDREGRVLQGFRWRPEGFCRKSAVDEHLTD